MTPKSSVIYSDANGGSERAALRVTGGGKAGAKRVGRRRTGAPGHYFNRRTFAGDFTAQQTVAFAV